MRDYMFSKKNFLVKNYSLIRMKLLYGYGIET